MAKIALSDLRSQYAEIYPPVDKTVDKAPYCFLRLRRFVAAAFFPSRDR